MDQVNHPTSPSRLTEFAPHDLEARPASGFFSRLFGKTGNDGRGPSPQQLLSSPHRERSIVDTSEDLTIEPSPEHSSSLEDISADDLEQGSSDSNSGSGNPVHQPRTLTSVLKRLSNILDRRSQTPQAYRDSDFKQYWMPDSNCRECYECGDKFNTFRRRHHCRICGQIFCSRCCNQEVPGKFMGYTGSLRVCCYCCKVVLSYAQNPDASTGDLGSLTEDLNKQLVSADPDSASSSSSVDLWTPVSKRKLASRNRVSTIFDEESLVQRRGSSGDLSSSPPRIFQSPPSASTNSRHRQALVQDSGQLREIWQQLMHPTDGVEFQSHRHRLRTYPTCAPGGQIIHWLINNDKVANRAQACAVGQALLDAQFLEPVTTTSQLFGDDYIVYRPGQRGSVEGSPDVSPPVVEEEDSSEPQWLKEIGHASEQDTGVFVSELNKIPSTVSAPGTSEELGSIFYVEPRDEGVPSVAAAAAATAIIAQPGEKVDIDTDKEAKNTDATTSVTSSLSADDDKDVANKSADTSWPEQQVEEVFAATCFVGRSAQFTMPEEDRVEDDYVIIGTNQDLTSASTGSGGETLTSSYKPSPLHILAQSAAIAANRACFDESAIKGRLLPGETSTPVTVEAETPPGWQSVDELREENGERKAFERLSQAHEEHVRNMTNQLLSKEGLSLMWADTVLSMTRRAAQLVRPDVRHEGDDMDIRQYVQIKKIPGGCRSDTSIVCGVVCSKNIPNRKMRNHIVNPKVLLLRAPIEYQRVENKFSSLEPQILQEHEFLRNCVGRIAALEPDILLVEKTVSRIAQDFLLDAGITLVVNVKPSVMDRISRFTQADIVTSIDGLVSRTSLGFCHQFSMKTYQMPDQDVQKSLMYFDGCPAHVGCTITLRGGMLPELRRVKAILQFILYATYHLKLELSFLMDEFAMPPAAPDENSILMGEADSQSELSLQMPSATTEPKQQSAKSCEKEEETETEMQENSLDDKETETKLKANCDKSMNSQIDNNNPNAQANCDKVAPENRQKKTIVKQESRISTSEILDFSDPLQNYQVSKDETIFHSDVTLQEDKTCSWRFKKVIKDIQLSASPYMKYCIPYLETETGQKCKMRQFFKGQLYWSENFSEQTDKKSKWVNEEVTPKKEAKVQMNEPHPFVMSKLTTPMSDPETQALLAEFRARGGRISSLFAEEKNKQSRQARASETAEQNNNKHEGKMDCLDPVHHQKIHVLFGSHSDVSANAPNPCVSPWIVSMDFYGRNDITLGQFLERYCFRPQYRCPSECCDTPMLDHVRRFVHDTGCIHIELRRQEKALPNINNAILMWSFCTICRQVTPVVPMTLDTWSMSFAKYLELGFHGRDYFRRGSAEACPHSLHHDHYQYFGFQDVVAKFKYYSIVLKEVALPPMIIGIQNPKVDDAAFVEEMKTLHYKGTGVYNAVWQHLHAEGQADVISTTPELNQQLQREKETFTKCVDALQAIMKNFSLELDARTERNLVFEIQDQLTEIKILVAGGVVGWNNRLSEIEIPQRRGQDKGSKLRLPADSQRNRDPSPDPSIVSSIESSRWNKEEDSEPTFFLGPSTAAESAAPISKDDFAGTSAAAAGTTAPVTWTDAEVAPPVPESVSSTNSKSSTSSELSQGKSEVTDMESKGHQRSKSLGDKKHNTGKLYSEVDGMPTNEKKSSSVKNIFSNFLNNSGAAHIQMPFMKMNGANQPPKEHYLLRPPYEKVPIVVYDQEPSSIIAFTLSTQEYERQLEDLKLGNLAHQPSPAFRRGLKQQDSTMSSGSVDAATSSSSLEALQDPQPNRGSKVLSFFRGDTSALSRERSPNRTNHSTAGSKFDVGSVKYIPKLDRDSVDESEDDASLFSATSEMDKLSTKSTSSSKPKDPEINYNIEMQFSDANARFYCRVYYADQFRKIRKLIFPEGEERYIRSLSRCFTWLARGGKSGSMFCKTQDDRFILKQMSRYEVQSFVEFAPAYFNYITQSYNEQKPTALAKILGVYRIGYKNSQTNSDLKQDLLVMENLFYERKITQIYDLKGSVRNRLVNTSGKRVEELVLLDENLLKTNVDSPLYIRPHSKTVLTLAITNDTEFLSSHLVMDYSLLVGVDDTSKELVIGIIDYIRTFTWDKKLEMVVKSTLSGQGKMPTVVSPELYRSRFLDAMDRYFLFVPDRWTGLGRNVDC